jgi:signal recognition particle receptor subunit beta
MVTVLPAELLTPLLGGAAPTEPIDLGQLILERDPYLHLWLIGTPCNRRFWPVWDVLRRDPATLVGAVVLADPRRPGDCVTAVGYLEYHQVPYVVAVNGPDPIEGLSTERIRAMLNVASSVPLVLGDLRRASAVRYGLTRLAEHSLTLHSNRARNETGGADDTG